MYIDPTPVTQKLGNSFTIAISVSNVPDFRFGISAWQVWLEWAPTVLNYISAQEGPFLKDYATSIGYTTYFSAPVSGTNSETGREYVILYCTLIVPWGTPGKAGSGTLAYVTFNVEGLGKTPLVFYKPYPETYPETYMLDQFTDYIAFTAVDGLFIDLSTWSQAYGSKLGDSNWDPDCDFNSDDKVDALDLFDLGKNYGGI